MDRQSILAGALGQAVKVEDLQKIMRDGFIVEVRIRRWRARKRLTLYELGIIPPDANAARAYDDLIDLGTSVLLPAQKLRDLETIERSARQCLKSCTFDTPLGRFLPYTSYPVWKTCNEEWKRRFYALRDEIAESYPQLWEELLAQYEQVARHSYFLLCEQYAERGDESFGQNFPAVEAFVQHFKLNLVARHIKSAEEFRETFRYEERFSRIQLDAGLGAEVVAEPEEILSEREARRAAAQKRKELLLQMERDLVERARAQKKTMIDQFMNSLMIQTRTITYDAVSSVLASIQKEDTLQGRPVIQLRELIKKIEQLNFYQDRDIDRMLTNLHAIIEKPAKERDLSEIQRQLRAIATLSRATVLALGDEPPRTEKEIDPQAIGIPAYPTDEEVREAREEIALVAAPSDQGEETREERMEVEARQGAGLNILVEERMEREG